MRSNIDKFKEDFERLTKAGEELKLILFEEVGPKKKTRPGRFFAKYQGWYSEAAVVIEQLLPQRLEEFVNLYESDSRRKTLNTSNYSIADYCMGLAPATNSFGQQTFDQGVVFMKYQMQVAILGSVSQRLESSLFDIKQLTQADLFDSELDAAEELLKQKFLRPAGVIVGVILEKHLAQVCSAHKLVVRKKAPHHQRTERSPKRIGSYRYAGLALNSTPL